jgi:hypothetical protein
MGVAGYEGVGSMSQDRFVRQEGGCCGVYALHICTGLPFATVFEGMAALLGKRRSWKGSSSTMERLKYLDAIGHRYEEIPEYRDKLVWQAAWGLQDCSYPNPVMVDIHMHVITLYEGLVIDQGEAHHPVHSSWSNWTIKRAYKMLEPPAHTMEDLI